MNRAIEDLARIYREKYNVKLHESGIPINPFCTIHKKKLSLSANLIWFCTECKLARDPQEEARRVERARERRLKVERRLKRLKEGGNKAR